MFFLSAFANAQGTSDRSLALYYYQNGEFEKAALYYVKLFDESESQPDFEKLFTCYSELEKFKEAEKLVKKQLKQKNTSLINYLLYGDLLVTKGELEESELMYEEAIDNINKSHQYMQISSLANEFQTRQKVDHAIRTYVRGQRYASNPVAYNTRIAELYGSKGETKKMVDQLVAMIKENEGYYVQVQNSLSRQIDFKEDEEKVEILRKELILATQQNPNKSTFNEMLIWMFEQRGEFESSYVQVKALDKKEQMKGRRILEFAQTCENNERYSLAVKAYNDVLAKGRNNLYYKTANYRLLYTLKKKITTSPDFTKEDLLSLEQRYITSLDRQGRGTHSIDLMKDLGHLQGTYLGKFDEAVDVLSSAVEFSKRTPKEQARCKILLGDVLVIKGDIWEASLYYQQVDKAFKEDVFANEAKFKSARIFYYTGNFELAQSQLDVLKGATSNLISNDAMELSLLITDNLAMDTTAKTMQLFADADLLIEQLKFEEANQKFDSINTLFAYHTLNDEILLRRYRIAYKQQKWDEAKAHLLEIVSTYGDDILADNALFHLGEMHETILKDKASAAKYYKDLMFNYQGSMYTIEARKRYRKLAKDLPKDTID